MGAHEALKHFLCTKQERLFYLLEEKPATRAQARALAEAAEQHAEVEKSGE